MALAESGVKVHELKGKKARWQQLKNLFAKLDKTGATPKKTRQRLQEAGRLATKELLEKQQGQGDGSFF